MGLAIYYVYAYISKKGLPYYIGKGKGRRAYNKSHCVSVPKDRSMIVFLETNLTEIGALALERRYIRWYGRKDIDTGILRNRTDGGEGASGVNYSEEYRRQVSVRMKGNKFGLGKKQSKERIEARIAKTRGKKRSDEFKQKKSISMRGNKNGIGNKSIRGQMRPEETVQKMKKTLKEVWKNKSEEEMREYREKCEKVWAKRKSQFDLGGVLLA